MRALFMKAYVESASKMSKEAPIRLITKLLITV